MELRHLKTFQVVAECLNLTKAAEQLGYSQPGITLQIQTLEKEVGRTLLTRAGRHTFLTPAGEVLKHHTDRLFAVVGELEEDFRKLDLPHGTLVIAAPEYYCIRYLPTIISRYVQLYPEVKLKLLTGNSVEVAKLVRDNQADIGIIAGDMEWPEIAATTIASEPIMMVISTALAGGRPNEEVLRTFPFLTDRVIEVNVCGNILAELAFNPATVVEFTSEAAIKQAVLNRLGMGVLGIGIIEAELQSGELREVHRFAKSLNTSIISLKSRSQEAGVQTFSKLVRESWEEAKK